MITKKTCVSFAVVAAFALWLGGAAAKAQDSGPKMQVFGGYSFGTNNCFGGCSDPGLHGYTAAFVYNLNKHIGLEANFSGHNGTSTTDQSLPTSTNDGFRDKVDENIYVYTFGPRLSVPVGKFSLFSHLLVGAGNLNATSTDQCLVHTGGTTCGFTSSTDKVHGTGFAAKFGGGVDWNHKSWGIRILEVDYVHGQLFANDTCSTCSNPNEGFDATGHAFELATGVTFNFGGMK
jgi:hypothetical protein